MSPVEVEKLCARVHAWLNQRGKEELPAIADALQLSVAASKENATVSGIVPDLYSPLDKHRDHCSTRTKLRWFRLC
jgi:hypothetical protein